MVNIKELRIGNIILINGLRTITSFLVLEHLYKEDILYTMEGLKINDDLLLKSGFVNSKNNVLQIRIDNGWFLNWQSNYVFISYLNDECEISHFKYKYIHQIQNLYFSLTGRELDFKCF